MSISLASQSWTAPRLDDGRLPFWIFDRRRRVPGTGVFDYLALARLLWPAAGKTVGEVIVCDGTLYRRLVEPLLLAALNIDPPHGSAKLAAAVIRETLAAGGRACRPLIARDGLGATLIEPAACWIRSNSRRARHEHQLRAIQLQRRSDRSTPFDDETWRWRPRTS